MTMTRDPQNVEAIFTTQAQDFDIGPARLECFRMLSITARPWTSDYHGEGLEVLESIAAAPIL